MVLSDIEIHAEIFAKRLVFDPPIFDDLERIDSSAVDLLLHEDLILLPESPETGYSVTPTDANFDIMRFLSRNGKPWSLTTAGYKLEPGHLIIGKTLEHITLPDHLAARIEGKSSLARFGLAVHVTAPTVIAGFKGRLFLEMHNVGPFTIELKHKMKISQLILEHVGLPPSKGYGGRFNLQD